MRGWVVIDFIRENFLIIMVWVLALCISICSYIAIQNVFPSFGEILLGHSIYAFIAMPNAFMHMVGLYVDNSVHSDLWFYIVAAAYWGAIVCAHVWYQEEKQGTCVAVIAFFVLTSSVKWLFFAEALMRPVMIHH